MTASASLSDVEAAVANGRASPRAAAPKKLRVMMLVNQMLPGAGAERVMVALATHLPTDRFDVMVVSTRAARGPLLEVLSTHGVAHVCLGRRGRFDVAPFGRLVTLLRTHKVDILHAHMFGSNFWGTVIGRLAGVPVIVAHEHSWSYVGQPVRRFIDGHLIGRFADAFVAVSERDRERMMSLEGVPSEKIVVLPNPYVPRPRSGSSDLRQELGIAPTAPLVATVAVLRPEKALDVLLKAFAELLEMVPGAVLAIAGDGECRQDLEQEARDLGIAEQVRFLGWWSDVGGLLETTDVATISSDREGAPLFALECMAHMTPLVSTDVGDVARLLGDGEGVVTVPRRDPSALAEAIAGLLLDPERRAAQTRAAALRLPRYEISNVTREFADLYESLLAATRRVSKQR